MAIGVMTWVWNHSRSRHGARLVLLAIADCASADGGNAWPSNAELRRKSGLTGRAVQLAITELTGLGELEVRYNAGPKGCNAYRVVMDADPRNIFAPENSSPPQNLRGSKRDGKKSPQADALDEPTPEESSPPKKTQDTPENSSPVTVLEPKPKNDPPDRSRARGTRIPDDFTVTPEMVAWAREHVPRLVEAGRAKSETDQFIDHWHQSSGPNARKLDWVAAWRTWLRREEKALGGRPQQRTSPRHANPDDQLAAALQRIGAREERDRDPHGNGTSRQVHQISLPAAGDG